MTPYSHKDFILSPLSGILSEMISSINLVGRGIEVCALHEYLIQSVFLRLTGAQEQKCKCVCWELASYDLEYRYARFNKWELSECSTLKDKSAVFSDLVKAVRVLKPKYKVFGSQPNEKDLLLQEVGTEMRRYFGDSGVSLCQQRKFDEFVDIWINIDRHNLEAGDALFKPLPDGSDIDTMTADCYLAGAYKLLYKMRNMMAHNTLSYQNNLPTLEVLANNAIQKFDNIFLFIAELLTIDKLFIRVFKKYESLIVYA
jgi:hypothetical protein